MELVNLVFMKFGKIFTIKRSDYPMKGLYSLPSGRVEGEALEKALVREINEELGVAVESLKYLGKIKYNAKDLLFSVDYFMGEFDEDMISLNKEEASETKWLEIWEFCSGLKASGLNTESVDNLNKLLNNIGL